MMLNSSLVEESQSFVVNLFQSFRMRNFAYHNLDHTRRVVAKAAELARVMDLPPDKEEIVLLAAWFHDTGYSVKYQGHEDASKHIASNFLTRHLVAQEKIKAVLLGIQATAIPQKPGNLMEQIICDADLAHLASAEFLHLLNALRREWNTYLGRVYSDPEWIRENLTFLNNHQYHTSFARQNWIKGKLKNIQLLQAQLVR